LNGRGAPHSEPRARARLEGLSLEHGRAHILKAVLEGLCCEVEFMRRRAVRWLKVDVPTLYVAGGGARSPQWMQLKADITGRPVRVLAVEDVTLLGAARQAMEHVPEVEVKRVVAPDAKTRQQYEELYARWEEGI
jgi:sugar (pentulose or hexulose) kinase